MWGGGALTELGLAERRKKNIRSDMVLRNVDATTRRFPKLAALTTSAFAVRVLEFFYYAKAIKKFRISEGDRRKFCEGYERIP